VRRIDSAAIKAHADLRFRSEYDYALFEYFRSAKVFAFLDQSGVRLEGRVLDMGCGGGGMPLSFAEETASVVAIDLIDRFRDAGKRMAVLTNKPVRMSRHIIEGLGVGEHFFQIYGGNSFERKKPHPMGVEALMQEAGVGKSDTLMVGDSAVDVQTARNAGIPCCGLTYGFQPETLANPAPDLLFDRMEQLADWLLLPARA